MSGHNDFGKLRRQVEARMAADPVARERYEGKRRAMHDALALAKLRTGRGVSQRTLAASMNVSQANVSRVEREEDVYLSTLSSYITALGGELRLTAVFPDETVQLG